MSIRNLSKQDLAEVSGGNPTGNFVVTLQAVGAFDRLSNEVQERLLSIALGMN